MDPRHSSLLCQDVEGRLVRLAVEVLEQGVFEDGVVGGSRQKQGHAGPEFQIVWITEDLLRATPLHVQNQLGTFSKSLT